LPGKTPKIDIDHRLGKKAQNMPPNNPFVGHKAPGLKFRHIACVIPEEIHLAH